MQSTQRIESSHSNLKEISSLQMSLQSIVESILKKAVNFERTEKHTKTRLSSPRILFKLSMFSNYLLSECERRKKLFSSGFSNTVQSELFNATNSSTTLKKIDIVETDDSSDEYCVAIEAESIYSDRISSSYLSDSRDNRVITCIIPKIFSNAEFRACSDRSLTFTYPCYFKERMSVLCRHILALYHFLLIIYCIKNFGSA